MMHLALKRMGNCLTDFVGSSPLQAHCLRCEKPSYLQHKDEQDLLVFWVGCQEEEQDSFFHYENVPLWPGLCHIHLIH